MIIANIVGINELIFHMTDKEAKYSYNMGLKIFNEFFESNKPII